MASFDDVAKQFATHFYTTFDTNRAALINLYQDQSMLTYESERCQGREAIYKKLMSVPTVKHAPAILQAQPSPGNGIIIFVSGNLGIEENPPVKFAETFLLMPGTGGGFFIHNNIFQLNYC
eukprot:TRINITY_DN16489_c0_g1_i1.p1 TRINITY_DN16489_c0_g1~~TRINITY_DN16489_c0_g1_i1.p1  ORF type:complete len:121 (-),score=20.26 TRINITY_DN16489_c0_g1_i1:145-507(-)